MIPSVFRNVARFARGSSLGSSVMRGRFASSLVSKFEGSVEKLPMREAVKYSAIKNGKWTATELKTKVDAHANGMLDIGIKAGDTIGVWMGECPERHVSLLAAAKMGLKVADIDTSISTVPQLRQALALAKAKAIIFHPITDAQNCLMLLRKSIPELFYYEDEYGQFFHSKHFPELQYFIQTGFDQEVGCLNYKYVKLPNPMVSAVAETAAATTDETPLYFKISGSGGAEVSAGPVLSHAAVEKADAWPFLKKLHNLEYFEVSSPSLTG